MQPIWIHLAGNPRGVKGGQPPFWRYRLGPTGETRYINSWEVNGFSNSQNITHGIELNADFLLWVALFGTISEEKNSSGSSTQAYIALAVPPGSPPATVPTFPTVRHDSMTVRIFGAPDLVNQHSPYCWRCEIRGKITELRSFKLHGAATPANFFPGTDLKQVNHRLWLTVQGQPQIDEEKNATFLLA